VTTDTVRLALPEAMVREAGIPYEGVRDLGSCAQQLLDQPDSTRTLLDQR
jgi:hypothetical protein